MSQEVAMVKIGTPACRLAAERRGWVPAFGAASLLAMTVLAASCARPVASAHSLDEQSTWNGQRITGQVKNNGPSKVACVVVEYALVNNQGGRLQTVSARKPDGLAPRDTWDFAINGASAAGATRASLTRLGPC
jgi:hypothetical protein